MIIGHDNMVSEPPAPLSACAQEAMATTETHDARVQQMLQQILVRMDAQGRKLDDMVSSLATTTSRLLGAAVDSTPSSPSTTALLDVAITSPAPSIGTPRVCADTCIITAHQMFGEMSPHVEGDHAVAEATPCTDSTLATVMLTKGSTSGPDPNTNEDQVAIMSWLSRVVSTAIPAPGEPSKVFLPKSFAHIQWDTPTPTRCSTMWPDRSIDMPIFDTSKLMLWPPLMKWDERQRWPPPSREEIKRSGEEVRPTPWLTFICYQGDSRSKQPWPPPPSHVEQQKRGGGHIQFKLSIHSALLLLPLWPPPTQTQLIQGLLVENSSNLQKLAVVGNSEMLLVARGSPGFNLEPSYFLCRQSHGRIYIAGHTKLTPDTFQVLKAADKLEKNLVSIAVEDSVDSDDGGKLLIREMPSYEAEIAIANLVKAWVKERVDRLKGWIDWSLQQETWNPKANRENFAPSPVEMLRIIGVTKCQGLGNVCFLHGISTQNGRTCIAMKFYEGSIGDKMARLKGGRLPLSYILRYGADMERGVLDLHSRGTLILNLKPCNFLLDEHDRVVLGDFGIPSLLVGLSLPNPDLNQRLGTPNYMAPEQWQPNFRGPISYETDLWGFACSILEMLSGIQPWRSKSPDEVYQLVVLKKERPIFPYNLPPEVENVLSGCFEYDFRDRPWMSDTLHAFESAKDIDYDNTGWNSSENLRADNPAQPSRTSWSQDKLQVGDKIRSRKLKNSCSPETMEISDGTVVGMDDDGECDGYILVQVQGLHDPFKVCSSRVERVTYGFAAGDWAQLREEDTKRSHVGILHSIDRNGAVYVNLIGMDTLWKGEYSDLQMAEAYCVGQFMRLKPNISQILPHGCLVVRIPGKLSLGEVCSCLADSSELEAVSSIPMVSSQWLGDKPHFKEGGMSRTGLACGFVVGCGPWAQEARGEFSGTTKGQA